MYENRYVLSRFINETQNSKRLSHKKNSPDVNSAIFPYTTKFLELMTIHYVRIQILLYIKFFVSCFIILK